MLDIFRNNEKKATTAVIKDSELDAALHIAKRLGVDDNYDNECGCPACKVLDVPFVGAAIMGDKYTGTVVCNEKDTYDEKVGEDEAVKKAMANHKRGFTKAIIRWQSTVIKAVMEVSPETFDEALKKVQK